MQILCFPNFDLSSLDGVLQKKNNRERDEFETKTNIYQLWLLSNHVVSDLPPLWVVCGICSLTVGKWDLMEDMVKVLDHFKGCERVCECVADNILPLGPHL